MIKPKKPAHATVPLINFNFFKFNFKCSLGGGNEGHSVANTWQKFPASLAGKNLAAKTLILPLGYQSFEGISTGNKKFLCGKSMQFL